MAPSQDNEAAENLPEKNANPGFVFGKLAEALETSETHADTATRTRAEGKVQKWLQVIQGMLSGTLNVGSRTPVAQTPAWATLEVAQGGFATGRLLAGGELQPHEKALLDGPGLSQSDSPRTALNHFYLGEEGLGQLREMLRTGCYRVNVPEEGALMAIAWLLEHDQPDAARAMLGEIGPYLDRLRFYPLPDAKPLSDTTLINLQTVGETISKLKAIHVPEVILAQREMTLVWSPLYDRAVALFLETVEGPTPSLLTGASGKLLRNGSGHFSIQGGWPCQHYDDQWSARAQALLDEYRDLRLQHQACDRPEREGENFYQLRKFLQICVEDPAKLSGRDVGRIRSILAHIVTRRGVPESEQCRTLRAYQREIISAPTNTEIAPVVIARLEALPLDEGIPDLTAALTPVTSEEAQKHDLQPGEDIEQRFGLRLRRAQSAPVESLVEQGIITSGEMLAKVIPQITAQAAGMAFPDADLQRLYGAIYSAFRRRRSLLLLNLQSQVKLAELPWIRAIDSSRRSDESTQDFARTTLEQVVTLALRAFPQQILPNKLLQEIRALATAAGLAIPIVDEIAADIFMGAFTAKYLDAAKIAATLLTGTLYERYYGFSCADVLGIPDARPAPSRTAPPSALFYKLCDELAGPIGHGSSVARNGTVIEQEQILTTHNLAALFVALDLTASPQLPLMELSRSCFTWVCRRQQVKASGWKAGLHTVKNAAYAWRQMIFFLSLMPEEPARDFFEWASEYFETQTPDFTKRFRPAMEGLRLAMDGLPTETPAFSQSGIPTRRFLGWSTGTHWLPGGR